MGTRGSLPFHTPLLNFIYRSNCQPIVLDGFVFHSVETRASTKINMIDDTTMNPAEDVVPAGDDMGADVAADDAVAEPQADEEAAA